MGDQNTNKLLEGKSSQENVELPKDTEIKRDHSNSPSPPIRVLERSEEAEVKGEDEDIETKDKDRKNPYSVYEQKHGVKSGDKRKRNKRSRSRGRRSRSREARRSRDRRTGSGDRHR